MKRRRVESNDDGNSRERGREKGERRTGKWACEPGAGTEHMKTGVRK